MRGLPRTGTGSFPEERTEIEGASREVKRIRKPYWRSAHFTLPPKPSTVHTRQIMTKTYLTGGFPVQSHEMPWTIDGFNQIEMGQKGVVHQSCNVQT